MLKIILIAVAVLIVAVLLFAATKPDTFRVQRVARIHAPAEKIFPLINDLHLWQSWSPYEKKDPAMQRTHSGAASGKGAHYAWKGNKEVGEGSLKIVESIAPTKVSMQLEFITPFEAHNMAEFTLRPDGELTVVTWAMHGPAPFISKLMQVFFNMDTLVGKDFEVGLEALKTQVEADRR